MSQPEDAAGRDDEGRSGPTAEELARTAGERRQALIEAGQVVMFGEATHEPAP